MKLTIFDIKHNVKKEKWETFRVAAPTLKDAIEVAEEMGVLLINITNILNTQQFINGVRMPPPEPAPEPTETA
jgi:hypothetical protein